MPRRDRGNNRSIRLLPGSTQALMLAEAVVDWPAMWLRVLPVLQVITCIQTTANAAWLQMLLVRAASRDPSRLPSPYCSVSPTQFLMAPR